jgi:hypothetical protein
MLLPNTIRALDINGMKLVEFLHHGNTQIRQVGRSSSATIEGYNCTWYTDER